MTWNEVKKFRCKLVDVLQATALKIKKWIGIVFARRAGFVRRVDLTWSFNSKNSSIYNNSYSNKHFRVNEFEQMLHAQVVTHACHETLCSGRYKTFSEMPACLQKALQKLLILG